MTKVRDHFYFWSLYPREFMEIRGPFIFLEQVSCNILKQLW